MPVPTNLPRSTYPLTTTPARAMHFRTSSNQSSSSPTITPAGNQHKLNVVTRLAVEGKAKQGEDGVSIKMYLKVRELGCNSLSAKSVASDFFAIRFHHAGLDYPTFSRLVPSSFTGIVSDTFQRKMLKSSHLKSIQSTATRFLIAFRPPFLPFFTMPLEL